MLARSFQVNSYAVGFSSADILHRVCCRITPNSLSGGSSSFFSSAVWITKLKFGDAEDRDDASRMRMHRLFLSSFEATFSLGLVMCRCA